MNYKLLLITLLACKSTFTMQKEVTIDLSPANHPWAHYAAHTGTAIAFNWAAEEILREPQQFIDERMQSFLDELRLREDEQQDLSTIISFWKNFYIGKYRTSTATAAGNIIADNIWGTQTTEKLRTTPRFFEGEVKNLQLAGSRRFREFYNKNREYYLQDAQFTQGVKTLAVDIAHTKVRKEITAKTQPYKRMLEEKARALHIPQYPCKSLINLAESKIISKAFIDPINNELTRIIADYYEKELLIKTAQDCACHTCIREVINQLPKNHPWIEILSPLAKKFADENKCCEHHKKI